MKSKQVYIRVLEFEDVVRTQPWLNRTDLGEIMGYLPRPLLQQQDWFRKVANDPNRFIFAICITKTNKHIGNVALSNVDWLHRHAMLSVFIADPKHRNAGHGREAVALILNFGFMRLNLHKIFLKTSPEYPRALDFYRGLGFVQEGILRKHEYKYGEFRDKYLFGLLRDEYLAQAEAQQAVNPVRARRV